MASSKYVKVTDVVDVLKKNDVAEEVIEKVNKLHAMNYETASWILIEINDTNVWACSCCRYPVSYAWNRPKDKFCRNCGCPITGEQ